MKLLCLRKDLIFSFKFLIEILNLKFGQFVVFKFIHPTAFQCLYMSTSRLFIINLNNFFLRKLFLRLMLLSVKKILIGICCGYFTKFNLVGYNYKFKTSFNSSYLVVFLGHCYSILIKFPKTVKIFKKKRSFTIFSTNLVDFNFTVFYLRHLRDLYPYKIRGLVLESENVVLKKGKKSKIR